MTNARIHPTASVDETATIGEGTQIWLLCQIRENARIGKDCILGRNVYVDTGVVIGDSVKIQNNATIHAGVSIEDGVFVGPHVCFTNDKLPRAVNPDMTRKGSADWTVSPTRVKTGASLGANATVLCGLTIGRWAMVAAGAVVTKDVPDHTLVVGNPARFVAWVCACGQRLELEEGQGEGQRPATRETATCSACGRAHVRDADGVRPA